MMEKVGETENRQGYRKYGMIVMLGGLQAARFFLFFYAGLLPFLSKACIQSALKK